MLQATTGTDYLNTIYATERRLSLPLKWLLFFGGIALLSGLGQPRTSALIILCFSLYGAANLLLSAVFYANRRLASPVIKLLLMLSLISDSLFVSLLVYFSGGIGSEYYLLYCLLALKAVVYYPLWPQLFIVLYLLGPVYVLVLFYNSSSFFFLGDMQFLLRYILLFGIVMVATYLGWLVQRRQAQLVRLSLSLANASQDLESKTDLMQRTAQDLGNRLMELRSLQEGAKAINSALALEDVLRLIVANASHVLGGARCAIALLDPRTDQVVTLAASGVSPEDLWGTRFDLGQGVAGWVVAQGKPALIGDIRRDDRFLRIGQEPISSIMCVPLISGDRPIGALSSTSPRRSAFNTEDLSRLEAFADQASIAVSNSRLYQSLFEKSTELEAILRGIGDGVIVTDPDLRLLLMNPTAARMFRLPRIPSDSPRLTSIIDNESIHALLRSALESQEHAAIEEIAVPNPQSPKRDTIYQGLASTVPAADGQVRGIVTVLRDITSQKELERMKSNFLSVVSHELRTPLHSIKGFVDIILMGKTGEVTDLQRDFLGTVKQQTTRLQALIGDLLEFSRLESGQIKLRISQASLYDLALSVVDKLNPLASEGQLTLSSWVPADLAAEADAGRIEQVLTNLVGNAIKFTPAGGVITIEGKDLGDEIMISVRDTGIGIPEEERERVFDRFYQVDSGSTRPYKGTGLGLTICKHIVEHHRGRIWVESNGSQGSLFSFSLPKVQPEEEDLQLDFTTLPSDRA